MKGNYYNYYTVISPISEFVCSVKFMINAVKTFILATIDFLSSQIEFVRRRQYIFLTSFRGK